MPIVTQETTDICGYFSLMNHWKPQKNWVLSVPRSKMMDLDKEMLNNGKNHEDIPGIEGK